MDPRIADTNARYQGLPPRLLMENAGRGIADYIKNNLSGRSVAIVCGTGNNGGDGFVIARHLEGSHHVDVMMPQDPSRIRTSESRENFRLLSMCDVNLIRSYHAPKDWAYDVIVDAMLGTGVRGDVREPYLSYIKKINGLDIFTLSVDTRSGQGTSECVRPNLVISLNEAKTDKAIVLPIGIPEPMKRICGPGNVKFLNRRPKSAHKGQGGTMAVIGGSEIYHGAPLYSAIAGSKICDLVYLLCPGGLSPVLRGMSPDFIVEGTKGGNIGSDILEHPRLGNVDSILCGVGAGRSEETANSLLGIYEKNGETPIVIDADGLFALRGHTEVLKGNMCLTPHANEFESIFGELPEDFGSRKRAVERAASENDCVIMLKGKSDIISCKYGTWENHTGNEGMTTGGTGDVLAGCTAAFASKNGLFESALASTFVVGTAGDMAYEKSNVFFSATDVLDMLPAALKFCIDY